MANPTTHPVRCIFCKTTNPAGGFTAEHVFPGAVGGTLVIYSVCKSCNDVLGHSVDVKITDHALIAMKRMQLGLAGKTGKVPNPLKAGTLASDPEQKLLFRTDPTKPGGTDIYLQPLLKRTMTGPKEGQITVRIDARDADRLGDMVNTSLRRAGARLLSTEEIDALKREVVQTDTPVVNVPFAIDLSRYRQGLMKIVYELACQWLGDDYVNDPMATLLRDFIFDKDLALDPSSKYAIHGTMRLAPQRPFLPLWPDEQDHLRAYMPLGDEGEVGICVSVLGVMDAIIKVTDKRRWGNGGFVSIDPVSGVRRESTFTDEVDRLLTLHGPQRVEELLGLAKRGKAQQYPKVWRSYSKKTRVRR